MAKKKDLTEENVQAGEDDIAGEKFPKIAAKAKIKAITREINIIKPKFKDLVFSPGQEEQLAEWMDNQDELLITIEQFQSRMV